MAPGDDPHRAQYLLNQLGLYGRRSHGSPVGRRGAACRAGARARALARYSASRRADQPSRSCRPSNGWKASCGDALGDRACQPRSAVSRARCRRATLWLDRGRTQLLDRGFEAFEAWRDDLLEAGRARTAQDRSQDRDGAEHWVRYGVTARRKRNQRRLASCSICRRQRREHRRVAGTVKMSVGDADNSGTRGDRGEGDLQVLRRPHASCAMSRCASIAATVLGIVGANGAGKTTLLNLLIGAACAGQRHGHARLQSPHRDARSGAREPEPRRQPCAMC